MLGNKIRDNACFRYSYENLPQGKFVGEERLVITKEEFIACYKAWIENVEDAGKKENE